MKSTSTMIGALAIVFALSILLVVGVTRAAEISMGVHGWFALILGSIATVGLTGGLFWLTFHSSRSGHDEEVGFEE